ncbi:MAG: mechanosensitive ion channel, partial [Thermoguttaceae bacterium]|nr:mechanosensitive ion channel [Thermoguttaceae bacterium]
VVNGVEGSVESIGLRSTRIRSFYNSLIVIPNSSLATSTIDNMGRRQYRSYKTFIGIEYGTPVELIEAFCGGIRALIESYPNTRKDDIRVAVNELADSSINILLVCFFIAHSADEENSSRQRLILDVIRLANRLGVSFAFPSVTQYQIKQDAPTYSTLTEVKNNADAPTHFGAKLGKEIASEGEEDDASVV